jgi:fructose-bisphosphate aldolase, class I
MTTATAPAAAPPAPPLPTTTATTTDLAAVAAALVARGKGIAATDESPPTLGKRLEKADVQNTPAARAGWRGALYGADVGAWISGAILFSEALDQTDDAVVPLPHLLRRQGVLVGVKADLGLEPLTADGAAPGETITKGLDGLATRAAAWKAAGAAFVKWRAALRVGAGGAPPSPPAIAVNAAQLAEYAVVSQAAGLVPIVEPEILIDGDHDAGASAEAASAVLAAVVAALRSAGADLTALLIKPTPILPGADCPAPRPGWAELADLTLGVLCRAVPPEVPGVAFLSGGLSEADATACLNAINARRSVSDHGPWALTFSFGRALQASALDAWTAGMREAGGPPCPPAAVAAARAAFEAAAAANAAACVGQFTGPHPADGKGGSLREDFRGWRG